MIIEVLDEIISQAQMTAWDIKYIALSTNYMEQLISEVRAYAGTEFKVDALTFYKEVPLKTKDVPGFQVSYDFAIPALFEGTLTKS